MPLPVSPTSTSVRQPRTSSTSCLRAAHMGSASRAACSDVLTCCAASASSGCLSRAWHTQLVLGVLGLGLEVKSQRGDFLKTRPQHIVPSTRKVLASNPCTVVFSHSLGHIVYFTKEFTGTQMQAAACALHCFNNYKKRRPMVVILKYVSIERRPMHSMPVYIVHIHTVLYGCAASFYQPRQFDAALSSIRVRFATTH